MSGHIDRVVVLIDGSNAMRGADNHRKGFRIDYAALVRSLVGEDKLIRAYFFDCADIKRDSKKQTFIDALRSEGITVVLRPLRYRSDGSRFQKGVDVALATELLALCMQNAYDTAIIVSGDSDYAHAIERVKLTGKNVHCASWRSCLSSDLRMVADKVILLDSIAPMFDLDRSS
jgi:uncharacterized LabA/DUF88 family protein